MKYDSMALLLYVIGALVGEIRPGVDTIRVRIVDNHIQLVYYCDPDGDDYQEMAEVVDSTLISNFYADEVTTDFVLLPTNDRSPPLREHERTIYGRYRP